MSQTAKQQIVAYENGDGIKAYATAYTNADVNMQSARCMERYPSAKVMVVSDSDFWLLLGH